MDKFNLFWPIYEDLENEVIKLTKYIDFTDEQLKVYSVHIGNLIIRCAVEIEAISKKLYENFGGNMHLLDNDGKERKLYFDTDCLEFLDEKLLLSKKQIMITSSKMYFSDDKRYLKPLHKSNKRGSSGSKWKKAYQAIKHDRNHSIKYATIENLLNSLGALYILNLFYKNETIRLYDWAKDSKSNVRANSIIFSVCIYHATKINMNLNMGDNSIIRFASEDMDESIYIVKIDDDSFKDMFRKYKEDYEYGLKVFCSDEGFKKFKYEYMQGCGEIFRNKTKVQVAKLWGDVNIVTQYSNHSCFDIFRNVKCEAVLNLNMNIYPQLGENITNIPQPGIEAVF